MTYMGLGLGLMGLAILVEIWTYFGYILQWRNYDDVITFFLNFDFVMIGPWVPPGYALVLFFHCFNQSWNTLVVKHMPIVLIKCLMKCMQIREQLKSPITSQKLIEIHFFYKNTRAHFLLKIKNNPSLSRRTKSQILS